MYQIHNKLSSNSSNFYNIIQGTYLIKFYEIERKIQLLIVLTKILSCNFIYMLFHLVISQAGQSKMSVSKSTNVS